MILKQTYNRKTERTFLSIIEGYRDPVTKKPKQRTIRSLGYLDVLANEHEDPVAWGKALADRLTEEKKETAAEYAVQLDTGERLELSDGRDAAELRKNIGYLPFSRLYHELEIDGFWNDRRRYRRFGYNVNSVFKCLVYNRLLFPDSKIGAWRMRNMFFEDGDFGLHDVYGSLSYFLEHRTALLNRINSSIRKQYGRDDMLLYYDVTNYYFETDRNDEDILDDEGNVVREGLRKKGCSKEHRPLPIVQMGLFMDENQLPVTYELFRGNMVDCQTFPEVLDSTTENLGLSHRILVADKGMMSADNIRKIHLNHDGYVISYSVRKADQKFVDWVLSDEGYTEGYDSSTGELQFRMKSRFSPRSIDVSILDPDTGEKTGRKRKVTVNERQIVVWSRKYYEKARIERSRAVEKAEKLMNLRSSDPATLNVGARRYIRKDPVTAEGEMLVPDTYVVSLDEDRIRDEEALDGYYVICTNVVGTPEKGNEPAGWRPMDPDRKFRYNRDGFFELNREVSDSDIVDIYSGLWKIEETFKVTKTDLQARPVYVSTPDHIRSHFLICFTSLVLMRLLQYRLGWKYSASAIQQTLKEATGTLISNSNVYAFSHYDRILEDIGRNVGLDFSYRNLTRKKIISMLAETKKN